MRRSAALLCLAFAMTGIVILLNFQLQTGSDALALHDASPSVPASGSGLAVAPFGLALGTMPLNTWTSGSLLLSGGCLFVIATVEVGVPSGRAQSLRERVVGEIAANPGIHLRELLRSVGCAMGALQYHVKNLEREGLIVSVRTGNLKHFFVAGFSSDANVLRLVALLRNPTIAAIVRECTASGPTTQASLSRTLSMDKSLVSYYVGLLLKAGVLKTIPVFGRERPLTLTDWARDALSQWSAQ